MKSLLALIVLAAPMAFAESGPGNGDRHAKAPACDRLLLDRGVEESRARAICQDIPTGGLACVQTVLAVSGADLEIIPNVCGAESRISIECLAFALDLGSSRTKVDNLCRDLSAESLACVVNGYREAPRDVVLLRSDCERRSN